MKKSLLFILVVAGIISFGVYKNANNSEHNEKTATRTTAEKFAEKATNYSEFAKWRRSMIANVETGEVNPEDYYNALEEVKQLEANSNATNKTGATELEWVSRGPDSQGGRTRTMLFDKDDDQLIFTGSISGGLFKSEDAGGSWARVESFYENNASIVSSAQTLNGDIFIGTGEFIAQNPSGDAFAVEFTGSGIYKSSDKGATWSSIDDTNENTSPSNLGEWAGVNKLFAHPTNPNILFAANKSGLRYTQNASDAQPTFSNIAGINGFVYDVHIVENGQEGWATRGAAVYKSNGNLLTDSWVNAGLPASGSRAQLAVSKLDENGDYTVYVSVTGNGGGCLVGLYKTEDKGATWTQLVYAGGQDPFAQPTADPGATSGCQGFYDHCIAVSPVDKDKVYLGGITLYTYGAGIGFKRADQIDSEGANNFDPTYIHADKHGLFFNPHDETGNTLFIVGDGGISKTTNAYTGFPDEMVFADHNKNYVTLSSLSIGSGKYGEVITGAQDNGTQYNNYKGISPLATVEASGGDGMNGAEISNFSPDILFMGSQSGSIQRSLSGGASHSAFVDGTIDPGGCGKVTCKAPDSGSGEDCKSPSVEGENFYYHFYLMETFDRKTPRQDAYIFARDETIDLPGGGVAYVKDTVLPGNVIAHENMRFGTISKMDVTDFVDGSGNPMEFNLPAGTTLFPGDTFRFDNPFDAKYFIPSTCGSKFFVCTNPLQDGTPTFYDVNIPNQSNILNMDASKDGDMLIGVGRNSRVIIMQGWDAFVDGSSPIAVTNPTGIPSGRVLSNVAIDPNDKNHVLITVSGYGGLEKVFESTNAASASPSFTSVNGDLPQMPVYSCIIDVTDPNRFIIGTELGVFISENGGTNWLPANNGIGQKMPIVALRQEWVNNFNCYLISAGALGGGMYTTKTLSTCDVQYGAPSAITQLKQKVNSVAVFPNPVKDVANLVFNTSEKMNITISIVDLSGRVMSSKYYENLSSGEQKIQINVSDLAASTYFAVISSENKVYGNKLFVKK